MSVTAKIVKVNRSPLQLSTRITLEIDVVERLEDTLHPSFPRNIGNDAWRAVLDAFQRWNIECGPDVKADLKDWSESG